ncbi:sporulation protein YqfC [Effusibacillus dendaii]|uniref:Sporulation protein YqfC n=1 Tax=Effusibacillus dendaii TaxID=2743772 RepID=A0A7I8D7T6_9BACL|nr:sporulation protein YqfC [Effusibacillus dendaii]BCJ86223.1 sporulation protein YqfC [Effusibacillus dendaii]
MRAFQRVKTYAANLLEMPKDVIYDVPRITLFGGMQISIENHTGILEFKDTMIRLSHSQGELRVTGRRLTIKHILPSEIVIEGEIRGITLG